MVDICFRSKPSIVFLSCFLDIKFPGLAVGLSSLYLYYSSRGIACQDEKCYTFTMSIIRPKLKKIKEPAQPEQPTPEDIILALDIGTEYVKTVIAKQQKDKTLEIIGVGKTRQNPNNMYAGAIADIPGVVATCERALSQAERQAKTICKLAVVGIAGELIKGNTATVRYRRKNGNKPISEQEMSLIIKRVQERAGEKARKEVALETGNPDVEVRLINSAIVSLSIDGYKVSNPIGFKGSDLSIQFYTAFAPLVHISAIEKVCAELNLDLLAVAVEPFAVCRACLGDDLESNFSAIVMDIGGGTTDIAVVDDGGVEGTKMFNIGGRSFTHQIATKLGTDFETAEVIKLGKGHKLTSTEQRKFDKAISTNIEVWLGGVGLALEDFKNVELLPGKILLCGGGAGLVALQEALATADWWNDLPFARRPVVHLLDDVDIPGLKNATTIDLDYSFITAFGLLRVALDTLAGTEEGTGLRARIAKLLQN
jgi:cell division protein FtsA